MKRTLVRGLPSITVFADHLSASQGPDHSLPGCGKLSIYQNKLNLNLDVYTKKVYKSSQFLASLLYNYGLLLKLD